MLVVDCGRHFRSISEALGALKVNLNSTYKVLRVSLDTPERFAGTLELLDRLVVSTLDLRMKVQFYSSISVVHQRSVHDYILNG